MIALLFSPIGKIIAGGLLILALATGIYAKGHSDGTQRVEARVAREVAAERERQRAASDAVLSAAKRQAEQSEAENVANEQRLEKFEAELASREAEIDKLIAEDAARPGPVPAKGCTCSSNPKVSPGDARRLNEIK
jgi:hypothetical protein